MVLNPFFAIFLSLHSRLNLFGQFSAASCVTAIPSHFKVGHSRMLLAAVRLGSPQAKLGPPIKTFGGDNFWEIITKLLRHPIAWGGFITSTSPAKETEGSL